MKGCEFIPCGMCERPLALVPDCRPLLLHCEAGHWCSLDGLLRKGLPAERGQSERVLEAWEARGRILQDLVRQALANGHALAAADLQDAVEQIARRVREVRRFNLAEFEAIPSGNGSAR